MVEGRHARGLQRLAVYTHTVVHTQRERLDRGAQTHRVDVHLLRARLRALAQREGERCLERVLQRRRETRAHVQLLVVREESIDQLGVAKTVL